MANTVTALYGSTEVLGDLTQFVGAEGDLLVINGTVAEILRVDSTSKLTLKKPWPIVTEPNATNWSIMKTAPYWHSTLGVAQKVIELIGKLEAGIPFKLDASGTQSGRAEYDGQDKGFTYLSTDTEPALLFVKRSATPGDWTDGVALQGTQGEPGPQGPAGAPLPNYTMIAQSLPAGSTPTVSATGTYPNQTIRFGIPQGAPGNPGPAGSTMQSVTYTNPRPLGLSDANKRVRMELQVDGDLTVPNSSSVNFPIDTRIEVFCAGEGNVTLVPASGVTLKPATGLTLTDVGQWLTIQKVTTNSWDVFKASVSTGTGTGPAVTLGNISLSNSSIPENAILDTIVGAVIGKTPNSTLSLPSDAGGRFKIVGSNILVAGNNVLDFESFPSHQIVIRETLAGATNTPNDSTITISILNVQEGSAPTLAPLGLSASALPEMSPEGTMIGAISGRTIGSIITLANDASGKVKLSGTNLVAGATQADYETTPSFQIVLRETLTGATNTPRDTTLTITVGNLAEGGTSLNELSITRARVAETALPGDWVDDVLGQSGGSTLSMTANGGGRFTLVGGEIRVAGGQFAWAASSNHIVTIRETHPTAVNSPRDTSFRIAVERTPDGTLVPLRLQPNSVPESLAVGNIIGSVLDVALGSTLSLVSNSNNRIAIVGNTIRVGTAGLDFETAPTLTFVVRETLAGQSNSPRDTTLTVSVTDVVEGGGTEDTSPNDFSFGAPLTGLDLNTVYESPTITIDGISAAAPVTVTGGLSYSKNGGSYTTAATTVVNGNTLKVRNTSSTSFNTSKTGRLTVGDKYADFVLTTKIDPATQTPTSVSISPMTAGPWKCTMPYNSSGAASGTAVEVWPPALATTDNQWFDRQADGSIIFKAPTTGAKTSGSSYVRCELREILPDGSNEYEWLTSHGGKLECTCAVISLPTLTKVGNDRRVIIGQIHGPNDEPCRLYWMASGAAATTGYLAFADDKAGSGQTETFFTLRDSTGAQMNIPLGAKITYAIEMDSTGIRVQAVHGGKLYTAFSPLSSFWVGKLQYFKAGAYNSIGSVGQGSTNEGTGESVVQFWRIINPKHPHTISGNALDPNTAPGGSTVTLQALTLEPNTMVAGAAANTPVGTLQGLAPNSALSLSNNDGGRFALSGSTIVTGATPTTMSDAVPRQITVVETHNTAANSPRSSTITITQSPAAPTSTVLFGAYNGYAERLADGSRAYIPTETMLQRPIDMLMAFSDHQAAGGWGNGTGNISDTMESSAAYNIQQIAGSGKRLIWSQACAMGYGPWNVFEGASMVDVAAGAGASTFAYIGAQLVSNGFANAIIRIGWEHNIQQFPWGNPWIDQNTHAAQFIAAFRKVVDAFRAVPGNTFKFHWCPNKCKPGHPSSTAEIAYPGDAYVDYVGLDCYDDDLDWENPQGFGTNVSKTRQQRWTESVLGNTTADAYSGGGRLAWLKVFATARGKGIIIGEWGAGQPCSIQDPAVDRSFALQKAYQGGDDGVYHANFLAWMHENGVYGHGFYDVFGTDINFTCAACWDPGVTGMGLNGYASTTAVAVALGRKTYTVASGLPFKTGIPVIIRSNAAPNDVFLEATVFSYSGTTLTVDVWAIKGTGTPAAVTIYPHPSSIMPLTVAALRAGAGEGGGGEEPPEDPGVTVWTGSNLLNASGRNNLTHSSWEWNWTNGTGTTLQTDGITSTLSQGNIPTRVSTPAIAASAGQPYSFRFIAKAAGGPTCSAAMNIAGAYRLYIIDLATGGTTNAGGELNASITVGAADGNGERVIQMTCTPGSAGNLIVEFGVGNWMLGKVGGRDFVVYTTQNIPSLPAGQDFVMSGDAQTHTLGESDYVTGPT